MDGTHRLQSMPLSLERGRPLDMPAAEGGRLACACACCCCCCCCCIDELDGRAACLGDAGRKAEDGDAGRFACVATAGEGGRLGSNAEEGRCPGGGFDLDRATKVGRAAVAVGCACDEGEETRLWRGHALTRDWHGGSSVRWWLL
eukprot:269194-Pelagomonas_calceolata.AAC.5